MALFLATLGLYGVPAYHVARRRHEIGVRVALGARLPEIAGSILRRGFRLVGVGLVAGIGAALGAARLIREHLFQVEATDPLTSLGVSVFFRLVALAACLIPAWRAWRVDPVVAFRAD